MTHPDKDIMTKCIKLAQDSLKKNGNAVGAIVVKNGKIISRGMTNIKIKNDSTCHAEINAIRLASKKLNNRYLNDCYLYTTYEPCPMCTSAAIWAKMKGIVYGASHKDRTPQEHWRIMIPAMDVIKRGKPKLELYQEFMRDQCIPLLNK